MLQVLKITSSSRFIQNKYCIINNLTNMQQVPKITNSSRLEIQVSKDAQFWLPLVKHEQMTWLNEESRVMISLPKSIDEFWALNNAAQDNVLAAWFTILFNI